MNPPQASHLSAAPPVLGGSTGRTAGDELTHEDPQDNDNTTYLDGSAGSESSAEFVTDVNTTMWRVMPLLFLAFGTFGNVMIVLVMRGMRASPSTACLSIYFTALAVSDQCQLIPVTLFFWVNFGFTWPPSFYRYDILCFVPKCMWNVTGITSAWFLVAMTYQRVISVVAPHRVGVLCTVRRGKLIVAAIVLFGFGLNSHFLFTWRYYPQFGECHFREQYMYLLDYFEWQDMLCYSALPFIFLIVGNSVLIWHVIQSVRISLKMRVSADQQKASKTNKVHSMSVTLIATSFAYIVFTFPPCVFDLYMKENYVKLRYNEAVLSMIRTFTMFFWITPMTTNFYVYLLSGNKFRQEAKRYLPCRDVTEHAK